MATPIPEALTNNDCLSTARTSSDYATCFLSVASDDRKIAKKTEQGYDKALRNTWKAAALKFGSICENVLQEYA